MSAPDPAPSPAAVPAAALEDVTCRTVTPAGPQVALEGMSLDVLPGLVVATGRRGAGVSTLLRVLACVQRPTTGRVSVGGADATALDQAARRDLRRRFIGVVHPEPDANVLDGLDVGANLVWSARRRARATLTAAGVEAHLEMVGLGGAAQRRVRQLSSGERQRLGLACALAGAPRLVVADEPTSMVPGLDAPRLANALRDAADRGVAVVVGSTDPQLLELADTIVTLSYGRRIA